MTKLNYEERKEMPEGATVVAAVKRKYPEIDVEK